MTRGPLEEGSRYITLYDQTYGSLHLSGRLLEPGVAEKVFAKAVELLEVDSLFANLTAESIKAIQTLAEATKVASTEIPELFMTELASSIAPSSEQMVQIILPESLGIDQLNDNAEFYVEGVFYTPGGLLYRGRHHYDTEISVKITIPIENLVPIPEESRLG